MIPLCQYIDPNITTRLSNSAGTFPEIRKEERPFTVDKYVLQKLNELEQEIKTLKEIITQYGDKTSTRNS